MIGAKTQNNQVVPAEIYLRGQVVACKHGWASYYVKCSGKWYVL